MRYEHIMYLSGSGNLFTLIDNRTNKLNAEYFAENAAMLTTPDNAIIKRTDGVIVINSPLDKECDYDVWFFNPDGTSEMMCGNGGRCSIYFATKYFLKDYVDGELVTFSMNGRRYYGRKNVDTYSIYFPPPMVFPTYRQFEISIDGNAVNVSGFYSNVGTDHFVIEVENIDDVDVQTLGSAIRYSSEFHPNGTNVNFYAIDGVGKLRIRTYERGVEGETAACGTGTIATALTYSGKYKYTKKIDVIPLSHSPLNVDVVYAGDAIEQIILSGAVDEL
jgi:diaminopimelate epimerase